MLDAIGEGSAVISFATALGSVNHLILAEIASHLGLPVSTLPIRVFESAPFALADLVAGSGDIAVVSAVSAAPALGEGRVASVLVSSPQRLDGVFAPTPTCVELGVPCVRGTWRGLVGPPGLDRSIVDAWAGRLGAAIGSDAWRRLLEDNLWTSTFLGPDETGQFMEAERQQLSPLLEKVGLVTTVGDG
jgi:putative tricarboxylic transport membrane protein